MEESAQLLVEVSLDDADPAELDKLTRQLRSEIAGLSVDAIEDVHVGSAPRGAKSAELSALGQMAITLAPTIIPPLFDLLKSWIERKPSTPVKVTVRAGRKTAQIEYDPTKTSAKDLEILIQALGKTKRK